MTSTLRALLIVTTQLWFANLSKGWFFNDDNCYPVVGCFPTTGHFARRWSPQSPRSIGVSFVYKNTQENVFFNLEDTQMMMNNVYNPALKTVLIIHGYLESHDRPWVNTMAEALLATEPINLFLVSWQRGAMNLNYLQCAANARVAGAVVALFIEELIQLGGSASNFHIIGFSLGAHVAGYAGERVQGLGRITGLDPAGPGFVNTHWTVRLDPTDAVVVDAVHTDKNMGTLMPLATIDFYPNGGYDQPLCGIGALARFSEFLSQLANNCGYNLMESQNVQDMDGNIGWECSDETCPRFGYHLDYAQTPRPGIYRFATGESYPFCCE